MLLSGGLEGKREEGGETDEKPPCPDGGWGDMMASS